ncbi:hypothetical protein NDU88_006021 [Pleurodeles waltl]|uniref:Uncharacterized protein n=1 Tax=Pleurodeles waltl TaxID=8319 RepID=A0AAV7UNS6_PLEWA|nr:hypothetical protein NDU88_006021 [Pleurodeles waltl]
MECKLIYEDDDEELEEGKIQHWLETKAQSLDPKEMVGVAVTGSSRLRLQYKHLDRIGSTPGEHTKATTTRKRIPTRTSGLDRAKEKTEAEEARNTREQSEERSTNRNEQSKEEDDRGEERSKDIGGETPTRMRPLDERTRHVPGGAWLSQIRSCLRLSYFPLWSRNRSERGIAGEGPEERTQESE